MATETLSAPPRLARTLLATAMRRGRGSGDLPETRLRLTGVRADRERLTAYQRLCGLDVADELPHTYPQVLGLPVAMALMARPDFPLRPAGLVHVENEIILRHPLTVEDPLDITVSARDLRAHPKGRVVDLVTEAEVDGERVWEGRSTYLDRGEGDPDALREGAPGAPGGPPVARWRLPSDLGRRYAAVSGDVNPIHLHPLTARALGYRRPIVHGMWSYARVLAALGRVAAGPSRSRVWFRKPVLLPGSVDLLVAPTGKADEGERVAALRVSRSRGTEHLVLVLSTL